MRKAMTAGVVALASIYGAVAPALAEKLRRTSVEEYDAKSYEDKADTLSTAVTFFYRHQDPAKGECIARLFTRTAPDFSLPKGYIELDVTLEKARTMPPEERPSIERIIWNMLKDKCRL